MTEYFDIVDENDNVIGKATRDECHQKGYMHRAVHIIIVNSEGKMLLQKRSMNKDLYPGWWIDAAAGHVDSGELPADCAKRETMEEIGIETELTEILKIRKLWKGGGKIDNELVTVYAGKYDGPFDINSEEVELVKFFQLAEIMKMRKKEKFTPVTVAIFNELLNSPKLLKKLCLS